MPNEDDITLFLRENIDPEVLLEKKRQGNLLGYLTNISKKMVEQFRMGREPEPRRDTQIHGSQVTETRNNPETVRPPTPQPRSVHSREEERTNYNEGVWVSDL